MCVCPAEWNKLNVQWLKIIKKMGLNNQGLGRVFTNSMIKISWKVISVIKFYISAAVPCSW